MFKLADDRCLKIYSKEKFFLREKKVLEQIGVKSAIEIIELIKELKGLQFMRIDFSLRHTIYDKSGKLKIIDHVNSFRIQRSFPKRLFKDLKQLGLLAPFLVHVTI